MKLVAAAFATPEETISWAQSATEELKALFATFFTLNPPITVVEIDSETSDKVYKIKFTAPIPKDFRRKATEALNLAKNAFDQSTFAAMSVLHTVGTKDVYFPWASSVIDLDRLLLSRKIDTRIWDAIRAHQPYPTSDAYAGGNDLIRAMAKIANDKHTVGLSVFGEVLEYRHPPMSGRTTKMIINNPQWDPRKNEIELMRWQGDVDMQGDSNITLAICLKDSRLPHIVDAIYALETFAGKAELICESLKAECSQFAP
jgi:hypothetical protein